MSASATAVQDRKTVLVVDDAPANLRIVNEILHDRYRVRIATSGTKALELASSAPGPDLILLDVLMPGMNGYEVCAHLKSDPATRDIPVIFLTGQTEITDETRGFETGAVDYIHKPFSPAVVAARVQTHLALRETRQQLARQLRDLRSELETARQIQLLSILPREIPAIAGLDIAARYAAMTSVGGDFYDFLVVDEKRLGILVSDVSGHGMPSALIASMLKIALAAQSAVALDPARVLTGLNRALYGKFQSHYVTAAYVLIDSEARTLRFAGAGHPPPLLREAASGRTRALLENGLILGIFPDAAYSCAESSFSEGDRLLLYSDGISETFSPADDQYGEDRLICFLDRHAAGSSADLADALLDELASWRGSGAGREPDDDMTVVSARFASEVPPKSPSP